MDEGVKKKGIVEGLALLAYTIVLVMIACLTRGYVLKELYAEFLRLGSMPELTIISATAFVFTVSMFKNARPSKDAGFGYITKVAFTSVVTSYSAYWLSYLAKFILTY